MKRSNLFRILLLPQRLKTSLYAKKEETDSTRGDHPASEVNISNNEIDSDIESKSISLDIDNLDTLGSEGRSTSPGTANKKGRNLTKPPSPANKDAELDFEISLDSEGHETDGEESRSVREVPQAAMASAVVEPVRSRIGRTSEDRAGAYAEGKRKQDLELDELLAMLDDAE
jgi:hypothetical protein